MRSPRQFSAAVWFMCMAVMGSAAMSSNPEALVVSIGDQHSAYERTAQFVALVDKLKSEHPTLPLAILLNGDVFEYGNVIARRSAGLVDFAMFSALAERAPTILNLGNHEPEFYDLAETVRKVEATGVKVITTIVNRSTGLPFAPASVRVKLGRAEATVVGITTDHLSTYRQAVRPSLDLANPATWAAQNFPGLLGSASLPIVMSHAGLAADREILPLVPNGTLFAGAHDHLRFVHSMGPSVYLHSGAWNEYLSVAWLRRDAAGLPVWSVDQIEIQVGAPANPEIARLVAEVRLKYLMPEDTAIIGRSNAAMSPAEAARAVAHILTASLGVDAVFIGNTTFGAGLPKGPISRIEFDACVRFDGAIYTAEIAGARLQALLLAANQGVDEPWENRRGEFLFADGPREIDPTKHYRIGTTDWGARNTAAYFGAPAINWQELAGQKLKARVIAGLVGP